MPLDERDKLILSELQKDSDRTNKKIAKLVGLSAAAYSARKERLKEEGYIKGIHAVLEPTSAGLHATGFVLVKLNKKGRQADEKFSKIAEGIPNVLEVHSVFGQYDSILKLRAKSNEELLEIAERIAQEGDVTTETFVVARSAFERTIIEFINQDDNNKNE